MTVTVTVFRAGVWVGELSANAEIVEIPGMLQEMVDDLTKRGVRAMPEKG